GIRYFHVTGVQTCALPISSMGIHYNEGADLLDYLRDPEVFAVHDGSVALLTGPGLGIDVDEERVREMAKVGHSWRNPVWRNPDEIGRASGRASDDGVGNLF